MAQTEKLDAPIRFPAARGGLLAAHILSAVVLLAVTGAAVWRLLAFPPGPIGALSLAAAAAGAILLPAVLYRVIFLGAACYEVDPVGVLSIRFGSWIETIPVEEIEEIRSGSRISQSLRRSAPGWIDMWHGRSDDPEEGLVEWTATDRGSRLLLLITKGMRLAVSPADPAVFARCLADLSTHGSLEKITAVSLQPPLVIAEILKNKTALGLLAGGWIGIFSLGFFLTWIMPGLPADQPFRFDPYGAPTSLGSPIRLLILPMAGLFVWLANAFIGWQVWRKGQRHPAFALWGVALVSAGGLWFAAASLLTAQ